ncbi:enoyl-CoA hydratase/isomerase family protein [uncultured Tateyamaria sp.]|uniref:enoyl-CoA hydratase/isomerase family protein n=1 Tax=uncultured Tateyamaria sp. TaxID=455651 RepID=UPI002602F75E|nr:enoyl-CoA hydratase/isomerase family protein [uncultured Tateyamaria sp.]
MIRVDDTGPIWEIRIDRPEKAGALTEAMLQDLADTLRTAHSARALILTSTGRVFSAGADLDAARAGLATSPLWEEVSGAIAALPGLVIAALNGTVAGGATGMVLACDMRIAVPQARFFYPVMKLGYLPQPSDPVRMSALIGPARTRMILLGGHKVDAETALAWGLVDEIVADGSVVDRARELCADTVAAPLEIAHGIKAMCPVT